MVRKSQLPARRADHQSNRPWYQTERTPSFSVGQTFGEMVRILQREAVFGLQLLLAFSVSYTAVQLTRSWLSHTGVFTPAANVTSARVFWPENTLAIFPKPQTANPAQMANASATSQSPAQARQASGVNGSTAPFELAVTHSLGNHPQPAARLHINSTTYHWAAPRPSYVPRLKGQAYAASRRQARVARLPRSQYQRSYQVAASRPRLTKAGPSRSVQPIRRMLREEYKVSKLKSYEEYMNWVRKTLRDYKGG